MSIITVMIFCFGCLSMLPTVPDFHLCIPKDANRTQELERAHCNSTCTTENLVDTSQCIYKTHTFWAFVIFMCMGTIGFNVGNCVSDAACFDILGDDSVKYGKQRVWGTIGFGVTALLAGVIVNLNSDSKDMQPAMYIMLVLGIFDIVSIKWLKLPSFTSSDERSISSKIMTLLKCRSIVIFLIFATIAGIFDSFIIYYLFWFLEEVAQETNYWESIKLIEGCVVAAECLGGEILFFLLSEKILKRIGYSHCLSFCFLMYSIRLGLISTIKNPLWLIVIEFFLQGPTYALCYTCIVAYASAVTPPGATATVQGLVAGMDDGLGEYFEKSHLFEMLSEKLIFCSRLCYWIFSWRSIILRIWWPNDISDILHMRDSHEHCPYYPPSNKRNYG